jgi:hypothetical protein
MAQFDQVMAPPPEVLAQLAAVVQGPSVEVALQRLVKFPLKGSNDKGLLPAPWHLAMRLPYFVFARVRRGTVEGVSCVRVDEFITNEFLAAITPMIPVKTQLWWTASAGVEVLRDAFVEAFRLQKLDRVGGTTRRVELEWPFYRLRFLLADLEGLPTLVVGQ